MSERDHRRVGDLSDLESAKCEVGVEHCVAESPRCNAISDGDDRRHLPGHLRGQLSTASLFGLHHNQIGFDVADSGARKRVGKAHRRTLHVHDLDHRAQRDAVGGEALVHAGHTLKRDGHADRSTRRQ